MKPLWEQNGEGGGKDGKMANQAEIQSNRKASDNFHLISLSALKFNMSEPSSSWVEQRFGSLFQFESVCRNCQLFIRFASTVERFGRTCRLKSGRVIGNKVRNPDCLLFGFAATPFGLTTSPEDAPRWKAFVHAFSWSQQLKYLCRVLIISGINFNFPSEIYLFRYISKNKCFVALWNWIKINSETWLNVWLSFSDCFRPRGELPKIFE